MTYYLGSSQADIMFGQSMSTLPRLYQWVRTLTTPRSACRKRSALSQHSRLLLLPLTLACLAGSAPRASADAYSDFVLRYPQFVRAYYRFNNTGSVALDSSGNGHHGVYLNGARTSPDTPGPGSGGSSAEFDGIDDLIRIANASGFPTNSDRTIVCWVKLDSPPLDANRTFFEYGKPAFAQQFMSFITPQGGLGFQAGGDDLKLPSSIADGQWHMVSIVLLNDLSTVLFVDGEFAGTSGTEVGFGYNTPTEGGAAIGAPLTPQDGFLPFKGRVDELVVFNAIPFGSSDEFFPPLMAAMRAPKANVLDTFDRADGRLGSNWAGFTKSQRYRIVGNQVDVGSGGPIGWSASSLGSSQEAFVTLTKVDGRGPAQGLLLKVQDPRDQNKGALSVTYDALAGVVRVVTGRYPPAAVTTYTPLAVRFQDGDQLSARVLASGVVVVYRNGELLGSVPLTDQDQAFFNAKGGYTGLLYLNSPNALFDDFGGRTLTP